MHLPPLPYDTYDPKSCAYPIISPRRRPLTAMQPRQYAYQAKGGTTFYDKFC